MNRPKPISKKEFFRKFGVKEIDLVKKGLFVQEDLDELSRFAGGTTFIQKIFLLPPYLLFALKNPNFVSTFILPKLGLFNEQAIKNRYLPLKDKNPIKNCILKASIAAVFNPKIILEVGTYLGWGAAAFKTACPKSEVYTMNSRENYKGNNPITYKKIGYFYRKKNLKINQIWADSAFFDYTSIPKPDVVYIDGNHSYNYVYRDLDNASKIARKCIILDDFVPRDSKYFGPWNEGVVKATCDFVKKNGGLFKDAFHIEDSPLCIFIKS